MPCLYTHCPRLISPYGLGHQHLPSYDILYVAAQICTHFLDTARAAVRMSAHVAAVVQACGSKSLS